MGIGLYLVADTGNNQLITETTGGSTVSYSYYDNGNLESKTAGDDTTDYTWDWGNRLLSVSEPGGNTSYGYDGNGTRISKTQGGVKTKYINDVALPLVQVLMETNNSDVVQATYSYGRDLISMDRGGVDSYYNYDGLGSTRQLTNSAGAVTVSYTYDSFGNKIASSGTTENPYGFTGESQFNEADDLVFLRARYYDPSISRFISSDPIGYAGGLNLYAYCGNNSVNLTDPSGLYFIPGPVTEGHPSECGEIDGYYRHCLYSCRLHRWVLGAVPTYLCALYAGGDWPSDDESINNKRDREANREGLKNAWKIGKSCASACSDSTDRAGEKYCGD